ncbi:MAG: hypothetical protein ACR2HR_14260 [Euzebya sp.]
MSADTQTIHPFQAAVQSEDWAALTELLHPDVEFRSPAVFTPTVAARPASTS